MFEYAPRELAGPCGSITSVAMAIIFGANAIAFAVLKTAQAASANDPSTGYDRFTMRLGLGRRSEWSLVPSSEQNEGNAGDDEVKPVAETSLHAAPLAPTVKSCMDLMWLLIEFGGVMLLIYVSEFFPLFPHSKKVPNHSSLYR